MKILLVVEIKRRELHTTWRGYLRPRKSTLLDHIIYLYHFQFEFRQHIYKYFRNLTERLRVAHQVSELDAYFGDDYDYNNRKNVSAKLRNDSNGRHHMAKTLFIFRMRSEFITLS